MAYFDKDVERSHLDLFLSARRYATGEEWTFHCTCESPDFLCKRPDGTIVGVEHTRIAYNPERIELLESTRSFIWGLDNFAIFWDAAGAITKKEAKRRKEHWMYTNASVLVLDLPEGDRVEEMARG